MLYEFNQRYRDMDFSENSSAIQCTPHQSLLKKLFIALLVGLVLLFLISEKSTAAEHEIQLTAEETRDDGFGNKLLAYKMMSHKRNGVDITNRYNLNATIPGPTIELTEGDTVKISILNAIPDSDVPVSGISKQVSIHVHGVHYDILSDGTLKVINNLHDEGAGAGLEETYAVYEYKWDVAPGTAGTWAYHDHNFETHNGAEHRGLFGAIIVNPIGAPSFAKEYVLYLGDDAFWGMEINGDSTRMQSKHGPNPTLSAQANTDVRFHLIALGTDLHIFKLDGYQWFDPGTNNRINTVAIGPLEKHVFSIEAKHSAYYEDKNPSNQLLGMRGKLNVQ